MIKVIKQFNRLSENLKVYPINTIVSFDPKTEKNLIEQGYAIEHIIKKAEKKFIKSKKEKKEIKKP